MRANAAKRGGYGHRRSERDDGQHRVVTGMTRYQRASEGTSGYGAVLRPGFLKSRRFWAGFSRV